MMQQKGLSLAPIGHALIINPDWVEKVKAGDQAGIDTVLKASKVSELEIPKLWAAIKEAPDWFKIQE